MPITFAGVLIAAAAPSDVLVAASADDALLELTCSRTALNSALTCFSLNSRTPLGSAVYQAGAPWNDVVSPSVASTAAGML